MSDTNSTASPAGRPGELRLSQPRIAPVEKDEWSPAQRELLEPYERAGRLYNVFKTLANHPDLARDWLKFATYILQRNSLPPRDREILILRIGWLCQADYEFAQHTRIGKTVGMSDDEIARLRKQNETTGWSEHERLLIRATDELHAHAMIDDATWQGLRATYDQRQMMDLVFTVGQYHLVSMALNSFGVQLDPDLKRP